jgi:hypothetical protein
MAAKRGTASHVAASNGMLERLLELHAMAQMQIAKADERMARSDERFTHLEESMNERFARVDERFVRLEQAIATVVRMLEELPEAVRDKIGFAAAKP